MKAKIHLLCLLTMEVLTTIIKIIMNKSTAHVTFVKLYVLFVFKLAHFYTFGLIYISMF